MSIGAIYMDDRQIECALDELRVYLLRLIGLFIVVGGLVGVGVYLD